MASASAQENLLAVVLDVSDAFHHNTAAEESEQRVGPPDSIMSVPLVTWLSILVPMHVVGQLLHG